MCTQPIPEAKRAASRRLPDVPGLLIEVVGRPKAYWLFLAIAHDAKLSDVDALLRATWLECCDHLSEFAIGSTRHTSQPEPPPIFSSRPRAQSMHIEVGKLRLATGTAFEHRYDFGSTTVSDLSLVGPLPFAVPSKSAIVLAHNEAPGFACTACEAPAAWVCLECDGPDGEGFLCAACAESHECDEYLQRPIVNSPRMGICGYAGPGAG